MNAEVSEQIDTAVRLPNWPFLVASGFVTIYEYDRLLGTSFGTVLQALVTTYGDSVVTVVGVEPRMPYYRDEYSFFPAFQLEPGSAGSGYGEGMRHEPGGDPTGALAYTVNTLAIAGSSQAWSVWGQRDWEIGLLLTRDEFGPWGDQIVPAFGRDIDLNSIRSPAGWGVPLTERDLTTFWQNVRDRGSGQ